MRCLQGSAGTGPFQFLQLTRLVLDKHVRLGQSDIIPKGRRVTFI